MKRTIAFMGLVTAALFAHPQTLTVVNYSEYPIYETGITLTQEQVGQTPLRFKRSDTGKSVTTFKDGAGLVRVILDMQPKSQVKLIPEKIANWDAPQTSVSASGAQLRNGVVQMTMGDKGFNFGFDVPKATLIEESMMNFWVDDQNRGRLSNNDSKLLKPLGLLRFIDFPVENRKAFVAPDGRPTLTQTRKVGAMLTTETFELVPGQPVLIYRVRFENTGDKPLWIAYTGSGDGMAGKWSKKELLPGKELLQRKKFPHQADINGSETRPSWNGGLCRMSMESPESKCGIGLMTLLPTPGKVGQGSMIWGCGGYGFQLNMIDPAVGQFPFKVEPKGTLENGFMFLAAQANESVFRLTDDYWKSVQAGKPKIVPPTCAVFLNNAPIFAQAVTKIDACKDTALAVKLDFNRHFELRAPGATGVTFRPMDGSKKKTVTVSLAGKESISINNALTWTEEIPIALEMNGATCVSIVETMPTAPEMLSPIQEAKMTHISAMFRWVGLPMVTQYDLEYGLSPDFKNAVSLRVTSSEKYPYYIVPDDQLPAAGKWYWRIRGLKGDVLGVWSGTRTFTINTELTRKPLKRPLTPDNPLFTLEASRTRSYVNFKTDIPADIAPYVGIIVEGMEGVGIPVDTFAKGMAEQAPHPLMIRSHFVGLGDIEYLFQTLPNFVGIQGGEHLSAFCNGTEKMIYRHRLTKLCAKYGMFFQEADGTYKDDKWQDLMDKQGKFIRDYGQYLVFSQKNNIIRRQHYSMSSAMGLWLGGVSYQHGAWEDGGFYWQNAGFDGLGVCKGERSGVLKTMPRIFWAQVCVMGIARGCGIYSLDGQTLQYGIKEGERFGVWPSAIWDETGKISDAFKRFVVPVIRAAVQHKLIPSKETVTSQIKYAVYNDKKIPGDEKTWPHYEAYGPLYAATYGFRMMNHIHGQLFEFFPNTGRYSFIPVLPQGNEPINAKIKNLPVSELQDVAAVKKLFDDAYPQWYDGDAWVIQNNKTFCIMNSNENDPILQNYSVKVSDKALVMSMSGDIGVHSYALAASENNDSTFWFMSNTEYPDKYVTKVSFTCSRKPEWTITPAGAEKLVKWDMGTKVLTVWLDHAQGAADVVLK
ncbi:MAG: glycoside hydrolase family 98 domain-containing protein [bacterium]